MLSERRKFNRFDISLDIAFNDSKKSRAHFTGVTKNFSRSGLCFESDTVGHALSSLMELKVKLPDQDTFIPVSGNVAWKAQVKDKCWVGLEFSEINKEDKSRILDYAYDLWVEENRKLKSKGQG